MSARIISTLRYRDARRAIAWLCDALGFEVHALFADGDDVHHAQLVFGPAKGDMIMVSSARDDDFGRLSAPPEPGAKVHASAYLVVPDADAHHDRAVAHGAEIVLPLFDADYGGRGYSCRDPEGYLWSVGTYDPWAGPTYKPAGFNDVAPYLLVADARATAGFLEAAFGAVTLDVTTTPDGRVAHCQVRLGDTVVMFGEPGGDAPSEAHVHVYVKDVDATYAAALAAGGTSVQAPVKKDDPDRRGGVRDPFGTTWWMGTRVGG